MKKLILFLTILIIVLSFACCVEEKIEPFYLKAGEKGQYGRMLTYNKGKEFEENFYAYYVPSGTYTITNEGKYMTQVNVYSDEIKVVDGYEEPTDAKTYLLKIDETKEIIVPKGYHIEISEPTHIKLQKIS